MFCNVLCAYVPVCLCAVCACVPIYLCTVCCVLYAVCRVPYAVPQDMMDGVHQSGSLPVPLRGLKQGENVGTLVISKVGHTPKLGHQYGGTHLS